MKNNNALNIVWPNNPPKKERCISMMDFHVWIGDSHILDKVTANFNKKEITCIIGPSGSGKSTLIRSINRINDGVPGYSVKGELLLDDKSIYDKSVNVALLRSEIGMVFQKPCVFPMSISENVLFGIQRLKKMSKQEKRQIVEDNLKEVALWKEVSHRLNDKASSLSLGQQQRLCIARTIALQPRVILFDEPTSSLDPVSARAIEDLMLRLKKRFTLVFVTHNILQAKRIADHLIFMCDGRIIEQGRADAMFRSPSNVQTKLYLNDEYCEC